MSVSFKISNRSVSTLAAGLHDTAQILLSLCASLGDKNSQPESADLQAKPFQINFPHGKRGVPAEKNRQYRIPDYTVKEKNELLAHYKAKNLAEVLSEIHDEFYVTIFLMQGYDAINDDLNNFRLNLIGEHLSRTLGLLGKVCSMFADFDLVNVSHATITD